MEFLKYIRPPTFFLRSFELNYSKLWSTQMSWKSYFQASNSRHSSFSITSKRSHWLASTGKFPLTSFEQNIPKDSSRSCDWIQFIVVVVEHEYVPSMLSTERERESNGIRAKPNRPTLHRSFQHTTSWYNLGGSHSDSEFRQSWETTGLPTNGMPGQPNRSWYPGPYSVNGTDWRPLPQRQ